MEIGTTRHRWGAAALAVGLLAGLAASATAQVPRELLRRDLERYRRNLTAYVQAVPDSVLGFRPTPEVRTFAEQIEHVVLDNANIVSTALRGDTLDWARPPRAEYLTSKEALVELVDASYDFVLRLLAESSDADLAAETRVFGRYRVPAWRAFEAAREHGTWTLGQTVPYLRLNGVTPPGYEVFDPSALDPEAPPPG